MDALVAGAGLAGCIAGLLLQEAGADFAIVERSAADKFGLAALHAHRFRPDDLEACAALLGVPVVTLSHYGRADLLNAMRQKLDAQGRIVWRERVERLERDEDDWCAQTRSGRIWRFENAIDASGAAYALAEKAEAAIAGTLDVSHIPDGWIYASWRVNRPAEPGWSAATEAGMVFCTPDQGAMIATLALPDSEVMEADMAAQVTAAHLKLPDTEIEGPPTLYRGSALTKTTGKAPALRIGDSLIRTPPRFGDGLHHALMTALIAVETEYHAAVEALDSYAEAVWSGTSLALALQAQSHPSRTEPA